MTDDTSSWPNIYQDGWPSLYQTSEVSGYTRDFPAAFAAANKMREDIGDTFGDLEDVTLIPHAEMPELGLPEPSVFWMLKYIKRSQPFSGSSDELGEIEGDDE